MPRWDAHRRPDRADARVASAAAQAARVRIRVPANTTIFGIGEKPTLRGAWVVSNSSM